MYDTPYEYKQFVLRRLPSVAMRYRKITNDLKDDWYKEEGEMNQFLLDLKSSYEKNNSETELNSISEDDEARYQIDRMARNVASEMLTNGKIKSYTMEDMMSLEDDEFKLVIEKSWELQKKYNDMIVEVENELNTGFKINSKDK